MRKVKTFFHLHKDSWIFKVLISLLVIFIVFVIIDNIVMPLYVKLGDEIEMPDVIEMSVQEAYRWRILRRNLLDSR